MKISNVIEPTREDLVKDLEQARRDAASWRDIALQLANRGNVDGRIIGAIVMTDHQRALHFLDQA